MTVTDLSKTQAAVRRWPDSARRIRGAFLILIADILLINISFFLGYFVRYQLQLFRAVLDPNDAPYNAYIQVQLAYT
jgi:hypothetical protein